MNISSVYDWTEIVRQFYTQKLMEEGFDFGQLNLIKTIDSVPGNVRDTYHCFGGVNAEPEPDVYKIKVQGRDTYVVSLWFREGAPDGYVTVFDERGQVLGVASAILDTTKKIKWSN